MAGPSIAKDLQNTLREAFATAERMRHEYLTLEHLLLACCDDRTAPSKAIKATAARAPACAPA
jgi:ATP-dependent Clp protease ATP-binding subunit ClpA